LLKRDSDRLEHELVVVREKNLQPPQSCSP
jgi:hypothetical protein